MCSVTNPGGREVQRENPCYLSGFVVLRDTPVLVIWPNSGDAL